MAVDFVTMSRAEQQDFLANIGQPPYRIKQIEHWIYEAGVLVWEDMTNLSKQLRQNLTDSGVMVLLPEIVSARESGWASKYGVKLADGEIVETVAMRYNYGVSLCVSTQVGCRMGCSFCAASKDGLLRNMSSAEILAQVLLVNSKLLPLGDRVGNIVVMGMGEPLDNYDNVLEFIRLTIDKVGIGARRITLSTCGVVPAIYRLSQENIPITLSVSLHAPNDELRKQIMPIGRSYPLKELIEAMRHYVVVTGRRVSVEYTLIEGVNDGAECARGLVQLLDRGFHVNLIAVNPIEGASWHKPENAKMQSFAEILRQAGLNVTLRRELGLDIEGSCGQLRRGKKEQS